MRRSVRYGNNRSAKLDACPFTEVIVIDVGQCRRGHDPIQRRQAHDLTRRLRFAGADVSGEPIPGRGESLLDAGWQDGDSARSDLQQPAVLYRRGADAGSVKRDDGAEALQLPFASGRILGGECLDEHAVCPLGAAAFAAACAWHQDHQAFRPDVPCPRGHVAPASGIVRPLNEEAEMPRWGASPTHRADSIDVDRDAPVTGDDRCGDGDPPDVSSRCRTNYAVMPGG